jgi:nitroreductase
MDFFDLIDSRHSMRGFLDTPIEDDQLQQILQAANRAPSAGNLQAYEIYVVRKGDQRDAVAAAADEQAFVAEAPLILIFCANPARSAAWYKKRGVELYSGQDATIACAFAMLAATALGLSTVWVGAFRDAEVRAAVGIPDVLRPVALLPIGHAGRKPPMTARRSLADLVHEV